MFTPENIMEFRAGALGFFAVYFGSRLPKLISDNQILTYKALAHVFSSISIYVTARMTEYALRSVDPLMPIAGFVFVAVSLVFMNEFIKKKT